MTNQTHSVKSLIAPVAVLMGVLALVTYNYVESGRQFKALQNSLGTNEEPLHFMARSIKPGMTREEVRLLIRGYVRLESLPADAMNEGGVDLFRFSFGIPLLPGEDGYGTIIVSYDRDGRVEGEATAETN